MVDDGFRASEGGVKVVFDVPEPSVADVSRVLAAAGFTVREYYPAKLAVGKGGAESGWVRLGAEMPRALFTDEEERRIVASFDGVQRSDGFVCERRGADTWDAGGGGEGGVREPRRRRPLVPAGAANAVPT